VQTQPGDGKHRLYGGGISKASFLMPAWWQRSGRNANGARRWQASPLRRRHQQGQLPDICLITKHDGEVTGESRKLALRLPHR